MPRRHLDHCHPIDQTPGRYFASCLNVSPHARMTSRPSATCSPSVGANGVTVTPAGVPVTNTVSPFCSFSRARISPGQDDAHSVADPGQFERGDEVVAVQRLRGGRSRQSAREALVSEGPRCRPEDQ